MNLLGGGLDGIPALDAFHHFALRGMGLGGTGESSGALMRAASSAPISSSGDDAESAALAEECDSWNWDSALGLVESTQIDFESWSDLFLDSMTPSCSHGIGLILAPKSQYGRLARQPHCHCLFNYNGIDDSNAGTHTHMQLCRR